MQSRSPSTTPIPDSGPSSPRCRGIGALLTAILLLSAVDSRALDFSGNIRLLWIDTQFQNGATNGLEQQYNLQLRQHLSPFLLARLTYNRFQVDTRPDGGESFGRRFQQPRLELLYSRPTVTARLGYAYREATGTFDINNFVSQGINGTLTWRILPRLSLNLGYSNDINETDPGAFGRETTTESARATIRYDRSFGGVSYSYSNLNLDNDSSGLVVDQQRHDLHLNAARDFFSDRLSLALSGRAGYSEGSRAAAEGADLAEPVPATEGLFAVDLTPGLGELEPTPDLINGDVITPVSPPIEIGAANTFRNIGLDLGITRPISRLEIYVDRPSGPNVVWDVYTSRDNLFWAPLLGVNSEWDPDLLRYTLRLPETEDRFFKAVNVSVNPADRVNVTELRALLGRPGAVGQDPNSQDLYQADLSARYRFSSRVNATLGVGTSNDQTTSGGLLLQDYSINYARAGLNIDLARTLHLTFGYRSTDSRDGRNPPLDRGTQEGTASLTWNPLPTVDLRFTTSSRDEKEQSELLQRTLTSRVGVGLQLLSDLQLYTDLSYNRLEDPFSGFDRDSYNASIRFDSRPFRNWLLGGGYHYLLTETPEQETLLDRNNVFLQTSWSPGSFLTLTGTWRYYIDDFTDSLRQTYGLFYNPGPKLTFSATWDNFDTNTGRRTGNASAGLTYRLYRHVRFSARLSRSSFEQNSLPAEEVTSAQIGLTIGF